MFVPVKISLYRNLLGKKHTDLVSTMERLEEGVQKLKSTSAQVFGAFVACSAPRKESDFRKF